MKHYCDWPLDRGLDDYWVCPECDRGWVVVGTFTENASYQFWVPVGWNVYGGPEGPQVV